MNGAPCKLTIKVNTSDDKHTTNLVKEFYIAPPYINVKIIDEKNQYNFDDFLIVKAVPNELQNIKRVQLKLTMSKPVTL